MLGRLRLRLRRRAEAEWTAVSAEMSSAKQGRAEAPAAAGQETTVETLAALLFRHDPIGLDFGDNTDEYGPEAETIALRRDEVHSAQDAQRIVHEEFVRWFDADTAGPPDRYADIAGEIWHLWRSEAQ